MLVSPKKKKIMGEAQENAGKEHVSVQINGFRGDPLPRFVIGNRSSGKLEEGTYEEDEGDDLELSLGLSLNGRFGVDPKRAGKLIRSSSISNFIVGGDEANAYSPSGCTTAYAPLTRTCSLPAESEEEWRKRKELQMLRRMEAKRKRMEKLKNGRVVRDKCDWEDDSEDSGQGLVRSDGNALPVTAQPSSQGSGGSQGSGSGTSDFGNQPVQGVNKDSQVKSTSSMQSLPLTMEQKKGEAKPVTAADGKAQNPSASALKNPFLKAAVSDREGKEMCRNVMIDMPCVSTKGEGPHGKRIEGFLYRYRKGEEVKIVCVCHGSFLSPAEFVKHAGGGDVAHPLRHIVVSPSPLL